MCTLYVIIMSRTSFRVNPHSIVYMNVKEQLAIKAGEKVQCLSVRLQPNWWWVRI